MKVFPTHFDLKGLLIEYRSRLIEDGMKQTRKVVVGTGEHA